MKAVHVASLAIALAAAGCSASTAPVAMPNGTQCQVSTHTYVWGGYADKTCTDATGNTTTTRVVQSGLYN